MPSFLIATPFLGEWCGHGSTHGVNPAMRIRLQTADTAVRAAFNDLEPDERIDPWTGLGDATFAQWCAVSGPHVCWRPNAGHHSAGSAIDINPMENAYIVTRNGNVPGGEEGGEGLIDMRNRALAAYDRAMQFMTPPVAAADLSSRRPGESTQSVWARFKAVSDALVAYLNLAVHFQPVTVSRVAIENADDVSDEALLATISEAERLPLDQALARIDRAQYLRILRDYEHVRIPMAIGLPSAAPALTRNPARGFLNLRSEIVTALCDQGLRWGACDFSVGADGSSHNGAMMHFDLADDGGYQEIHSLLRFG